MSKTKIHRKENKVIAILTADWHLSHKPPIWRSNEPDWYEAMRRPLNELSELQKLYNCPILVAGDIFDKWNASAELINFAMMNIPNNVYAIAGQHDLPEHNIEQIDKSAYFSLALGKTIKELFYAKVQPLLEFNVYAFMYGDKIVKPDEHVTNSTGLPNIAVAHQYICKPGADYPNAPKEAYLNKKLVPKGKKWYGYDVMVFGDNHKSFFINIGDTKVFNCGTLMRRASDEENYKPRVGLLYSNGDIDFHYLDISQDKHLTPDEMKDAKEYEEIDMEDFAKELRKLGAAALDFSKAMKEFWLSDKTRKSVQDIILKAMGK